MISLIQYSRISLKENLFRLVMINRNIWFKVQVREKSKILKGI